MSRRFENFGARLEGQVPSPGASEEDTPTPVPDKPIEPGNEPDPDPEDTTDKEDEIMSDNKALEERDDYKAGFAAGEAAGSKSASDRINAVFAHENCKGREASAVKLLGKANMTADDIVDVLADMPALQPVSQEEANAAATAAAEEAARAEMQDEMKKNGNADLGADKNSDGKTVRAKADATWDRANAAVGRTKKEA